MASKKKPSRKGKKRPTKAQREKWSSSFGMGFDDPVPKEEAAAIETVLDNEERALKEKERRRKAIADGKDPKAPITRRG